MADFKDFIKSKLNVADRGANLIEYKDGGYEIYISFQLLLEFISENLNLVTNNDADIVKIDYQSDKPFYALSCHISTDLTVCYLYNDKLKIEDGNNGSGIPTFHPFTYFTDDIFDALNSNLRSESGATSENFVYPQVGNINFIYLNIGHLSEILSKNLDKDNKITLRKFLQTICDDLNRALGGVNDFQVVVDADNNNTLTIVDFYQSRIKGLVNAINGSPQFTTIQAQGTGIDNGDKATFVRRIQAQSNITSDMASAISIGAQANGNQLGIEATQFSRLSKGLIDRIYPEKYIKKTEGSVVSITEKFEDNIDSFKQLINNLKNNSGQGSQINITISDEKNNGPIVADLFKGIVGEFTDKNLSNPTFIPIKLELEILGISGIRIFEQFQLSSDVLPLSYQNDFNFIVTGVSHDITTHKWITKIAAYTYLKELPVSSSAEIKAIDLKLNSLSTSTPITYSPHQVLVGSAIDACVANTPSTISGFRVSSKVKRASGEFHGALDISTPEGTKLAFNLETILVKAYTSTSYGNTVFLKQAGGTNKGFEFRFAHLKEISSIIKNAKVGDVIPSGTLLGLTGNTGRSSGPHLHFEVRNAAGRQICPNEYAKGLKLG